MQCAFSKAAKLAEIKAELRREAMKVLNGNVQVDITANEDERILQMAKTEIENTVARMASIQDTASSTGPSREDVQNELAELKTKLDSISTPAASLVEEGTGTGCADDLPSARSLLQTKPLLANSDVAEDLRAMGGVSMNS